MASEVVPSGRVLGIDISDRFFPASRLPNVELVQADLRTHDLDDAAFDFVHCRLLLLHQTPPDRQLIVRRLHQARRPGGWIVALDPSFTLRIDAAASDIDTLFLRFVDAILAATSGRADFALGPRLTDVLIETGFSKIETWSVFPHGVPGSTYQAYLINSIEVLALRSGARAHDRGRS